MRGMNAQSASSRSCSRNTLDKRKACLFVILVAIAVLCACFLIYMLFYAGPHSGSPIHTPGQSLLRPVAPSLAPRSSVHS
jgi:hypothetical protein